MLIDPFFYMMAVPAVLIVGISKGGFGGGLGVIGVPLMTLAVSPTVAAAILLPILCVMDIFGMWAYRGKWDRANLVVLLPGAIVGIVLGSLTFGYLNEALIKLLIGLIAVIFTLNWFLKKRHVSEPRPGRASHGVFWGAVSGLTSFIAHAGGPPVSVYLMPQRLDKTVFQATTVLFFIVVNYVKLVPYGALGLFQTGNLATSLVLLPLAPLGIALGVWLHARVSEYWFYRICYVFLFLTGAKLIFEGLAAQLG